MTPGGKVKSSASVTIFSKLPASKRKKRAQKVYDDNVVGKVVDCVKLANTREISTVSCMKGEGDLSTLCEMFPQYDKSDLETMLYNNNKDLDETVSLLIGESTYNKSMKVQNVRH